MVRALSLGLAFISLTLTGVAGPQVLAREGPRFETASIKRNTSASQTSFIDGAQGRFNVVNTPLRFILLHAFNLRAHQLVGAPDWAWDERFDIVATYPAGQPGEAEQRVMLQQLLFERFGLASHADTRRLSMYALTVAQRGRLGPSLAQSAIDCDAMPVQARAGGGGRSTVAPGGRRDACTMAVTRRFLTGSSRTMSELASALQSLVKDPVVDQTHLMDRFDFDLSWDPTTTAAGAAPGAAAAPTDAPSIFTAVREQLGLKLERTTGPFPVVVIDRVNRPTPD